MLQAAASLSFAPAEAPPAPPAATSPDPQEAQWIRAARSGDRAAFTRLYERFAPVVHGVLLTRVARSDADDLVQDVFLIVWRKLGELRDPAAFPAWVLTIARNAAAGRARAAHRTAPLTSTLCAPPVREAVPDGECERALEAIRQLPESYRETLMLRLVQGLSGPEIAERTGLTHGSVRVNLCRGMALLRERLGLTDTNETKP
jgi:RNA polymerase sigma-70 factor, ECF subfamily